jgi:mRNA-degrading endonuclease RelE of RelBE toxin-antitoxin system
MSYKIKISKKLLNFIEELPNSKIILYKVKLLKHFKVQKLDLDLKKLQGKLLGKWRLRIGTIRVIFYENEDKIIIQRIDYRGKIYK